MENIEGLILKSITMVLREENDIVDNVKEKKDDIADNVKEKKYDIVDNVKEKFKKIFNKNEEIRKDVVNKIKDTTNNDIVDKSIDTFENDRTKDIDRFKHFIKHIKRGISGETTVGDKVDNVINKVEDVKEKTLSTSKKLVDQLKDHPLGAGLTAAAIATGIGALALRKRLAKAAKK